MTALRGKSGVEKVQVFESFRQTDLVDDGWSRQQQEAGTRPICTNPNKSGSFGRFRLGGWVAVLLGVLVAGGRGDRSQGVGDTVCEIHGLQTKTR